MSDWRRRFGYYTYHTEEIFDRIKLRLKKRLGRLGPIQILPYMGHGTRREFYLKGRVLEDKGITRASDNDTVWKNLLATYKRFGSVEIPGARVKARAGGVARTAVTNNEGYFDIHLKLARPAPADQMWQEVTFELLDPVAGIPGPVRAAGRVMVPPVDSRFGVISDIDDTIIETHATNLLKMARITFLNNARTRLPFEGVAGFYRALQQGPRKNGANPIFYVSRSVWNLYDLLEDFLRVHKIPDGPLLLRDHSLAYQTQSETRRRAHKFDQIARIMSVYDPLPFILIGDSGQRDPMIYREVIRAFPGRVLAVYIRDVGKTSSYGTIESIQQDLREHDAVDLVLAENTGKAALHAVENGFIHPDSLPEIDSEKDKDAKAPGDLENLLNHF